MAIIKAKDAAKMNESERNEKISELKMELIKSRAGAKKSRSPKEMKRTIARLLTFNSMQAKNKIPAKTQTKSGGKK